MARSNKKSKELVQKIEGLTEVVEMMKDLIPALTPVRFSCNVLSSFNNITFDTANI